MRDASAGRWLGWLAGLVVVSIAAHGWADEPAPVKPLTVTAVSDKPSAPRGAGDFHLQRDLLDASPHQQTSEMLSVVPGFFVDHEDGEGLGNDMNLRGFDLEHGSGIEFRVGGVPINIPMHVLGQGYADLNFVIPEVVRHVHVLEGAFDPRQGDAAIAGSIDVDLGVVERGYRASVTYGSFQQARLVGIFAPPAEDDATFAAVALRRTGGFGPGNRSSESVTANVQYAVDLGNGYRLRVLATEYGTQARLAGVVRRDDVDAGRVGFFDSYASPYAANQSIDSDRYLAGANLDRLTPAGRFEVSAWGMITSLRLRQNYTGNVESSTANPAVSGRGDLLQSTNDEAAAGASARLQSITLRPASFASLRVEPGISVRYGTSSQTQNLLAPDLSIWDRRLDAGLRTLDLGTYLDVDAALFRRLHVAGGLRVDALLVNVDDRLANEPRRTSFGVAASPRVSAGFDVTSWLTPTVSYGEGFRSLDARSLSNGSTQPYSKVRSVELGLRARLVDGRYVASLALFQTWVGNELVFEPDEGGLETEGASVRRGLVAGITARPLPWLLGSLALSLNRATFVTPSDGNRDVPNIPPLLFRADVSARGRLFAVAHHDVTGRVGTGFTLIAPRLLTDRIVGEANYVLNAGASARYRMIELGVDGYNLLDRRYPDDEEYFLSNWSGQGARPPASFARHISAAPPLTLLATLSVYL